MAKTFLNIGKDVVQREYSFTANRYENQNELMQSLLSILKVKGTHVLTLKFHFLYSLELWIFKSGALYFQRVCESLPMCNREWRKNSVLGFPSLHLLFLKAIYLKECRLHSLLGSSFHFTNTLPNLQCSEV